MWKPISERGHWSKACELVYIGVVGWSMVGCGGVESTDETGGGAGTDTGGAAGDDDGDQGLPGDVVQCCWIVTYGAALPCNAATCYTYAEEACLTPGNGTPCVDRQAADIDGDGSLGVNEVQTACGQVCLDQGYDGTQPVGSSNMIPADGAWDDPGGFVWNCSAIGTVNSNVVEGEQCTPAMFPDPPPFHVPTHIGLATRDASDGQVQINVLGTSLRPVFDATTNLALFDCTAGGHDGGSCKLQLEGLSLALAEPFAVGEHSIPSAELMLAGVVEAEVRFARCAKGSCTGHFQLSEQGGNPVGLGLAWVEHHEATRSTTTQFAPLSNGSAGFGGVSVLDGLVSFDPMARSGTLVLQGSGRDTFGDGAFASALFRLELELASRAQR
jgi:hypothetical protein